MTYLLVQNDTAPAIQANLTRSHDGSVIDCSDATVSLKFRAKGTTTTLFTLTAIDNQSDLENGIAIFYFADGNLDLDEGYYEGEIEIAFLNRTVETVYETLEFYLRADF
jgi:hypothetical protein